MITREEAEAVISEFGATKYGWVTHGIDTLPWAETIVALYDRLDRCERPRPTQATTCTACDGCCLVAGHECASCDGKGWVNNVPLPGSADPGP